MRYNVVDLLRAPTGETREAELEGYLDLSEDGVRLAGPVRGRIRLMRGPDGVIAAGRLRVPVRTECARCLEPVEAEMVIDLEESFRPSVEIPGGPEAAPADDDDAATLIDELHVLDLTEVLRQGILLALPVHPLCRADCKGLCPTCGANWNEGPCTCTPEPDPRWEALREILDDAD